MNNTPVSVEVDGDTIRVTAPYRMTVALNAIPGARFDSTGRAWVYPASPIVAQAIARVLAGDPSMLGGRKWESLIGQASAEQQATDAKSADDLPEIPGLSGTSWNHQKQAYWFAAGRDATMLAIKMRYGKTRIAVGLMRQAKTTLVLCPLSVVPVWPAEIAKHAPDWNPIVVALDSGSVADKRDKLGRALYPFIKSGGAGELVVIVNYDSARMDPLAKVLISRGWDLVILDESHKIKAAGGRTSMFCARLRDKARKRLCLTGTPMPHSPLDVYAQYRFLDPSIFGTSFTRMKNRYAITVNVGLPKVVGWQNMDDLNARFYSAAYKAPDGVIDMPEELHVDRFVRLGDATRRAYKEMEENLYTEVDAGIVTAANALVKLLRLSQMAGGVTTLDDGTVHRISNEKGDLLAEVLDELGVDPVVVVCRFHADLDAVHAAASALGLASAELSGRRRELDAWQSGGAQVLAVQIQSGGTGINLSRADVMILYSVGYSLGDLDQALARIRISGKPNVTYVHLVAQDTVDMNIRRALETRADLVESALRRRP